MMDPFPAMTWTELWFGMPLVLLSGALILVRNWFIGGDRDMPGGDLDDE